MVEALKAHQFTSEPRPDRKPKRKSPYSQMLELQDSLLAESKRPECKGVALASVARAFRDLEAMKREIRMQPKPKSVDVGGLGGRGRGKVKVLRAPVLVEDEVPVQKTNADPVPADCCGVEAAKSAS
jgi:hypothetical protein